MIILLSPAKTLDYETPPHIAKHTQSTMLKQASELIEHLRKISPQQLSTMMKLSDKLAALNVARYASWQLPFTSDNAKQAVLAFKGDVYTGLDASTLTEDDLQWAQEHLRILSGLYGLLKPLDLMQAYRLEMGTKLANSRGKNLYEYWGNQITDQLNNTLQKNAAPVLLNLASNEYYQSVKTANIQSPVITPIFKDEKNGKYKIISFFAKKARGLMARWIIENRITDTERLKEFASSGYYFSPADSTETQWVFLRDAA